jgi:hypothetical protein
MKSIIYFFSICLILLVDNGCASAQNNVPEKQAVQMLREFYTAYSKIKFTVKYRNQIDSLQKKYCTIKLRKELKEEFKAGGLDHDPLTNDYGMDDVKLKTMLIKRESATVNVYSVSYTTSTTSPANKPIEEKVTLHVAVAEETGVLKIASVK